MKIDGWKIKKLVEVYGIEKGYDTKSYLTRFCEDHELNYIQWNAYTRDSQNIGMKIIHLLMYVFPSLNLNWLLKDDENMFLTEENTSIVSDTKIKYGENITNLDLMLKLEEIHLTLKKNHIQ